MHKKRTLVFLSIFVVFTTAFLGFLKGGFGSNSELSQLALVSSSRDFSIEIPYEFAPSSISREEKKFDFPILNFDEKSFLADNPTVELGVIRDFWGYPERNNYYKELAQRKTSGARNDDNTNIPGLVNCRANTEVTGYFKAYFEEVALDLGVGYDDPTYGATRREKACQVLKDIAHLIMLDTTDVTPDILFMKNPGGLPFGALAAASAYTGFYQTDVDDGSLHKHIISQTDPTPALGSFDAFLITNFNGISWDDAGLNTDTYHLQTVLYHEVMHALGFRSLLPLEITDTNVYHIHTTFDKYLYEDDTLANSYFLPNTTYLQAPAGAPSPWFINNTTVYRGVRNLLNTVVDGVRPVFTPNPWQQGSSLSHFDMNRSNGQVYLMHPSIGTNTIRNIHEHEKEVLCHAGYRVLGMMGCETLIPVAVNDEKVLLNPVSTLCIDPLANDIVFSNGALIIKEVLTVHWETGDSRTYYATSDCTGASQTNSLNAKSVKFTFANSINPRIFQYKNADSISGGISNSARIHVLNCNADSDEYVCNGGLDGGLLVTNYNSLFAFYCGSEFSNTGSEVPFWCNFLGTPDLEENPQNNCPIISPGCPVAPPDNSKFFFHTLYSTLNTNPSPETATGEGLATLLKEPLVPGQSYELSFDVFINDYFPDSNSNQNDAPTKVVVGLAEEPKIIPDFNSSNMPPLSQIILDKNIPSNTGQWFHIVQPFEADTDSQFLAIYGSYSNYEHAGYSNFYYDNFSIKKTLPAPGIIKIIKDIQPGYDSQDFKYSRSFGEDFVLDDDTDPVLSNTAVLEVETDGYYTVKEFLPSSEYYIESINCSDPSGGTTVNVGDGTAKIKISNKETVTCTFVNKRLPTLPACTPSKNVKCGTIRITKNTIPDDYQDFTFIRNFGGNFVLDDDGTLPNPSSIPNSMSFLVPANGLFKVSEILTPGFSTSVSCSDPTNDTTTSSATANIKMSNAEGISCFFYNTKIQ